MKTIDALGKTCPIPVIESKKALADKEVDSILVKVDNTVAVQNLEKMAAGYGYSFSYTEKAKGSFEVIISRDGKNPPENEAESCVIDSGNGGSASNGLGVTIGRNTMGAGAEELGKILIKGFIYSLTELPNPPKFVIFFNSGAYLTSGDANTIDDLKKLEQKGTEILTCGTCINYYELQGKLAVGAVADMYGITERIAGAARVINI